ncbi:MAG: plasmid pRiA4b ORF-3 family protein [Ignavibacteriaceae bacterium]|nr:plasmid pRiA4b ORF-3 family protein [Ignavibacteriaceae bacterium]
MSFLFKILLKNITDLLVWRRLLVPEQFTFLQFYKTIQVAFGWDNSHLFQFPPNGYGSHPVIVIPNPEWDDEPPLDSKKAKLYEIFTTPKQKLIYIHDFGDDWARTITLEKMTEDKLLHADCIAGQGASPPENRGGAWGYANLKIVLDVHNPPPIINE